MALELQDYTTFTEVDPGGYISYVQPTVFGGTVNRAHDCYLAKDFGQGALTSDFVLEQTISTGTTYVYTTIIYLSVSNMMGGYTDHTNANEPFISVYGGADGSSSSQPYHIRYYDGSGMVDSSRSQSLSSHVDRIFRLSKTGTVYTLDIRLASDDSQIFNTSLDIGLSLSARYIHAMATADTGDTSRSHTYTCSFLYADVGQPPAAPKVNPLLFAQDF